MRDGEPWFVGRDVAEALGYNNTKDAINTHVQEDDRALLLRSEIATFENYILKSVLPATYVRAEIPNRGLTIINESGIYALIFGSKLPKAKEFKHWVTSEVLPTIRKHGSYNSVPVNTDCKTIYEQAMKTIQDMIIPVVESMKMLAPIVTDLIHRVDKLEHAHYNVGGAAVLPSISGMSAKEWSAYQIRNVKVITYSQGKTKKEVLSSIYRAMEDQNKMVLREQIKNESGSVFAAVERNHSLRYMFDEAMNTKLQGYGLSPARIPIRDGQ